MRGFDRPIDAELIGHRLYVLEYGGSQRLWEISFPATPAVLSASASDAPGGFRITLSAPAGQAYELQASTNLLRWFALTNVYLNHPQFQFVDPLPLAPASGSTARRAVERRAAFARRANPPPAAIAPRPVAGLGSLTTGGPAAVIARGAVAALGEHARPFRQRHRIGGPRGKRPSWHHESDLDGMNIWRAANAATPIMTGPTPRRSFSISVKPIKPNTA